MTELKGLAADAKMLQGLAVDAKMPQDLAAVETMHLA